MLSGPHMMMMLAPNFFVRQKEGAQSEEEENSPGHRFNPVKHIAAPPTDGCYLFSNPF